MTGSGYPLRLAVSSESEGRPPAIGCGLSVEAPGALCLSAIRFVCTLPAIFFGHGNPMNALADNAYTRAWRALGQAWPKPRAVLCISAHWYVPGCAVTAMLIAAHDS